MLTIEMLMVIVNICATSSELDKDIQESVRCNQSITRCMIENSKLDKNEAFTKCYVRYEIGRNQ